MNASAELSPQEVLTIKLEVLRRDHRTLDEAIREQEGVASRDLLALQRLKKQKLALKDQIARLEDRLIPDIIA